MYKINLLQSLVTLLVLVALLQYGSGLQQICGPDLEEALDEICWNGYNLKIRKSCEYFLEKAQCNENVNLHELIGVGLSFFMQWQDYECNEGAADERLPYPYTTSPFLVNIQSEDLKLMTKYGGHGYGVYDECCLKACTRNVMLSYCLQIDTFY